jgi:hypothetical protein
MSFVAVQPPVVREQVFAAVRALMDSHPQLRGRESFDLPYVTEVFWAPREA